MKKAAIIAATVAVLGVSALAVTAYARQDGWGPRFWRHSTADMTAFANARIAALKAGLALTPEQEKFWPPVETTLQELSGKYIERREQFRAERRDRMDRRDRADKGDQRPGTNPIDRLRRGSDRLTEAGTDLKRLADATQPLYDSLDDAQKRRFNILVRPGMRGLHHEGRRWRRFGDLGDEGRHMRPRGHGPDGGPGFRHRIEWAPEAPEGAERL